MDAGVAVGVVALERASLVGLVAALEAAVAVIDALSDKLSAPVDVAAARVGEDDGDGGGICDAEAEPLAGTPIVRVLEGVAGGVELRDSAGTGVSDAEAGGAAETAIDGVDVVDTGVPSIATLSTRNVLALPTPQDIRQQKLAAFEAPSGRSPVDHPRLQPVVVMGRSATGCVKFTPSVVHSSRAQFGVPTLLDPLLKSVTHETPVKPVVGTHA